VPGLSPTVNDSGRGPDPCDMPVRVGCFTGPRNLGVELSVSLRLRYPPPRKKRISATPRRIIIQSWLVLVALGFGLSRLAVIQ